MRNEAILTEEHRRQGLELREDDDFVYLLQHGKIAAVFSALAATPESLREEAERLLGLKEARENGCQRP
jgi:hypothetical protein